MRSIGRSCRCRPRTRTGWPTGCHSSSSPTATLPEATVPVTTVPCPATVNERSIAMRKSPGSLAGWTAEQAARSASLSSSSPAPVDGRRPHDRRASRNVPRTSERMSSSTRSSQDGSTRSHLVSATTPDERPSKVRISHVFARLRHDRVVGRDDSMARSRPEAPASMLRMNRSWPGTSMRAT